MKTCSHCGGQSPDGAKFCVKCGQPFAHAGAGGTASQAPGDAPARDARASQAPGQTGAAPESAPAQPGAAPAPAPASTQAEAAPSPAGVSKRRGRKRVVAIALILILLAVGGVLGWQLLSGRFSSYALDEKTFPDEGVRASLAAFDIDGDGRISAEEAEDVTDVIIKGARQVDGLGIFQNLATIDIASPDVTSVDVSDVPSLRELYCSGDGALTSLALPATDALETVYVSGTGLTELDLSGATGLRRFDSTGASGLASLDFSAASDLETVGVDDATQVTGLEASGLREIWLPVSLQGDSGYAEVERDGQGRPVSLSYRMSAAGSPYEATYTYNDDGTLATMEDAGGVYEARYLDDGRIGSLVNTAENAGEGSEGDMPWGSIVFTYDDEGNYQGYYAVGGGDGYSFFYDAAGRLSYYGYADQSGQPSYPSIGGQWRYNDDGGVRQFDYRDEGYNLVDFVYDDAGRMIGSKISSGGSVPAGAGQDVNPFDVATRFVVNETSYTLDDDGNVASATYTADGNPGDPLRRATFTYEHGVCTEAQVENVYAGDVTTYEIELQRFILSEDAADPEPMLSIEPTYRKDLAAAVCHGYPYPCPEGYTYATNMFGYIEIS